MAQQTSESLVSGIRRWPAHEPIAPLSRADWLATLLPGVRAQLERVLVPVKHDEKARALPRIQILRRRGVDHIGESGR